ncbi:MAG TPA: type II toxin-antitoxin system RelE/ParE family toxin [Pyrinomonadaceae bacterium]|nr:type II toxin-antitoxin system RelE/ParE family toxin [Pyrinomonadaceae bacterium]
MAKVELTDAARNDLKEIHSYVASESDDLTADRLTDRILEKFKMLSNHNLAGVERFDMHDNLRSFQHGKYLIFYFPTEIGVEIFRVIHQARDIPQIFESDLLN